MKTYPQSGVDLFHLLSRELPDAFSKPTFIQGADILKLKHGCVQALYVGEYHMGRLVRLFVDAAGSRCDDDRGAESVTAVILKDKDGSDAVLFMPESRVEIRIVDLTTVVVAFILFHSAHLFYVTAASDELTAIIQSPMMGHGSDR